MSDYIRREDAIRLAEQGQVQGFPWQFQMLVKLLPADVVPVVRCKDCKQFRRWVNTDIEFCDLTESTVFGDDFCSRGERRE